MDADAAGISLQERLSAYRGVKAIARELDRRARELEACRRFPALALASGLLLIWVAFFSLRLLVQVPLYFADLVEQLALARAIMGAPAYAGLLALTWVLLRRIQQSKAVDYSSNSGGNQDE